ncbi:hypothetical protein [Ruania halotolerans]|uniref:hypothetical protein n=1 Tax=Ruania halotolerans TaxID=2897773 RepID=UPI001E3E0B9C|nr:hypothetical protein [Ruania halotolerans]UFU07132.1 hypothetical protein LQF10_03195 [Ruania halotolerans]
MSTVPPHDREERDPNAAPDESAAADTTQAADPASPAGSAPAADSDRADRYRADSSAGVAPDAGTAGPLPTDPASPAPPETPEPVVNREPTATPPASSSTGTGAHTRAVDPEPPTRQLPTEEDDAVLREQRARRFGRGTATPDQEPPVTSPAAPGGYADHTRVEPTTTRVETTPESDDPFSDWDEGPQSRAAAHWWGILIAIVFAPVAWYLLVDGGERVSFSLDRNLEAVNVAGLLELAGGIVCTVVLLIAARWSSVGPIIVGSIGTLIGAAFLAIPVIVQDFLDQQATVFDRLGQFGQNVFDHLVTEGHAGRLLLYGVVLIFVGIISHGARRQGRREERRKIAVES